MGGFLIIGLFIAIWLFTSINQSKNKKILEKKFGENFPFPNLDDTQQKQQYSFDDTGQREALADEIQTYTVNPTTSGYQSIDMANHVQPIEVNEKKKSNFDLRQAVIYSEILKPKYNDNIL